MEKMKHYLSLLVVCLITNFVSANVLTVTDTKTVTNDSTDLTPGTLWTTVRQAQKGDTIVFDPSLSGATILFDTTLTIVDSLTIDASALSQPVRFDGQGKTSLITLGRASTKNTSCQYNKLCNIIFQNGNATQAGYGGALNNFAYRIYIHNCQFIGNRNMTDNSNRQPGAIRNETSSSKMYLYDCVFRNNETLRKGGAIAIDAPTLYMERCLFDGNKSGESASCIAVKNTKDNVVLRDNENPRLEIRNSTFVNNINGNYEASGDGLVIMNEDAKSIMPIRLFACTFVNNRDTLNTNVKYSVVASTNNISVASCLFGGNTHITDEEDYALCGDVKCSGTAVITSFGYNTYYRFKHNVESSPIDSATDIKCSDWLENPLINPQVTNKGVCQPTDAAIASGDWKKLKVVPLEFLQEFLGYNATDQTGAIRPSVLAYIGAYEFPSFVLDVTDEMYGVTDPGIGRFVYQKDEQVLLNNNNTSMLSWVVNDRHYVGASIYLKMDSDYVVKANYTEIPPKPQGLLERFSNDASSATKIMKDGRVIILRKEQMYNLLGQPDL